MRTLLLLLFFVGACQVAPSTVKVSLSITPASLTRPCLVGKIAIYDDLGAEHHAIPGDCNESVLELPPGRSFAGFELQGDDVGAVSLYLQ